MNKRQRRKAEYLAQLYEFPDKKPSRSKRTRGKIRVRILGDHLNQRGRYSAARRSPT